MSWLKTLPIAYEGLLKDVKVVNFSVPLAEVVSLLPAGLKPMNFKGRAMISLADLQICQMRPKYLPKWLSLNYRHIALRLLVERTRRSQDAEPAIYFLKSFCASPCVICGGRWFTDYQLCKAKIRGKDDTSIETADGFLHYSLGHPHAEPDLPDMHRTARLNTAYALHDEQVWQTRIQPEDWPLEPVSCGNFSTNLFKNYRFEAAYQVKGNLCFKRTAPRLIIKTQRREHLRPFGHMCSPL